jgi:hypothetical protein
MSEPLPEELAEQIDHYCYICGKEFFLECGTPQVKIGGCCSGFVFGGIRYTRPVYAHLGCYQNKEVKRKQTIIPDYRFWAIMTRHIFGLIRNDEAALKEPTYQRYPELMKSISSDIAKHRNWIEILGPR